MTLSKTSSDAEHDSPLPTKSPASPVDENVHGLDGADDHSDEPEKPKSASSESKGIEVVEKKKKKKRGGKTKAAKSKPTGFEDYYADKPVLPEEWTTERELYSADNTFIERISTAMQRYETGRRFNNKRRDVFDDYLRFGGVDSRPKQFNAGQVEDATAGEIRDGKAKAQVEQRVLDGFGNTVVVDFNGVVSSWLSMRVPHVFELYNKEEIAIVTGTVRNFFNYLLKHDVCPEYEEDIMKARQTCDVAEQEFRCLNELNESGVGAWHVACTTLFNSTVYRSGSDEKDSARHAARQLITNWLPQLITDYEIEPTSFIKTVKVTDEIESGFEVLALRKLENLPFYHIDAKVWHHPVEEFVGTTEIPEPAAIDKLDLPDGKISFVIDDNVVENIFVGLKFEAILSVTNKPGFHFLSNWMILYPSFLTVTWNEWMRDYKPHQPKDRKSYNKGSPERDDDEAEVEEEEAS